MIQYLFALLVLMILTGCAGTTITTKDYATDGVTVVRETSQPGSIFGPSSFDVGYTAMFQSYEAGKTRRVEVLSDVSSCPSEDSSARAYCISLGKIAGMVVAVMDKFEIKAPVTGFDVMYKLTDSVVPVMGIYGIWQTAIGGFEAAGSHFGNGATLNNSLNRTSSASTAVGANPTVTSSASGTMPGSDPVFIEPFIVEVPIAP